MNKKALLALLLAVTMLLSGCALIEKDMTVDRATPVITLGDAVINKGEILDRMNYELTNMQYVYSMYGMEYDVTDPAVIADAQEMVISEYITEIVTVNKAAELGLDQLTEDEAAQVEEKVAETWNGYRDEVLTYYLADSELTGDALEAEIINMLASFGIRFEDLEASEKAAFVQQKLQDYVQAGVEVDEAEVQTYYNQLVETDKQAWAEYPEDFGDSFNNGYSIYYRPAGYRLVKQILVKYNAEDEAAINTLSNRITTLNNTVANQLVALNSFDAETLNSLRECVQTTVQPADDSLAATAMLETEVSFPEGMDETVAAQVTALVEAEAQRAFYQAQLEKVEAQAVAAIDAEADEVIAQLAAGADFDEMIALHNDDRGMQEGSPLAETGYAVSNDMTSFDEPFKAAAMALENVGDVSPKTLGAYGYYIIQYAADVEEGAVPLADVYDTVHNELLESKKTNVYETQMAQWVAAANAKVDLNALKD